MHYPIRLIVEGEDAETAMVMAEDYADSLVECGEFDWYNLDGRWGKSVPHKLTSQKGRALIKEGLEETRQEFDNAMRHVRYMLEHFSDDQIYNEQFGSWEDRGRPPEGVSYLSRWQFALAGGHSCYVFAEGAVWGGAVNSDDTLVVATKGRDDLWVVLVDFHN
jgi:hypothetical protein